MFPKNSLYTAAARVYNKQKKKVSVLQTKH